MTNDEERRLEGGESEGRSARLKKLTPSLLLKERRSVPVETERLGRIQACEMTTAMATALLKRLPEQDALGDADIARIFMGCTSGIPKSGQDSVSHPLTEQQAEELTDDDVRTFANAYLHELLRRPSTEDAIRDVAVHARAQRIEHAQRLADLGRTLKDQVSRITGNAELMKNWSALQETMGGSLKQLRDALRSVSGPDLLLSDSLRDMMTHQGTQAWRSAVDIARRDALDLPTMVREMNDLANCANELRIEPPFIPDFPPVSETPMGRTADAVEGLAESGARVERAVNAIVEQAGEVSDLIAGVSMTIQSESKAFQEQANEATRSAIRYSKISLVVATLALVASAILGGWGFVADREESESQGLQSEEFLAELRAQNEQLATIAAQQRQQMEAQEEQEEQVDQPRRAIDLDSDAAIRTQPVTSPPKDGEER